MAVTRDAGGGACWNNFPVLGFWWLRSAFPSCFNLTFASPTITTVQCLVMPFYCYFHLRFCIVLGVCLYRASLIRFDGGRYRCRLLRTRLISLSLLHVSDSCFDYSLNVIALAATLCVSFAAKIEYNMHVSRTPGNAALSRNNQTTTLRGFESSLYASAGS